MTRRRAGIKQVAKAAGVSITTVSHVLNDKGRVNEDTRARVKAVAAELGYTPYPAAQQLANGRDRTVAFMIRAGEREFLPPTDYEYFNELMDGVTAEAMARGHRIILMPSMVDPAQLDALHVDGAILVDPLRGEPVIDALNRQGIHVVTTGRDASTSGGDYWVDNDHAVGTRLVLEHLADQGADRIALINADPRHSYALDAQAAYEKWCASRGYKPLIATIGPALDESAGFEATLELFNGPSRPDAIHTILDRVGLGVLLAARSQGRRVPEDLLITTTTDTLASRVARPALTVLSLEPNEIGRLAAEMLLDLMEGCEPAEPHRTVATYLIPRASSNRTRRNGDA